jgi:ferrous iron transport protein A
MKLSQLPHGRKARITRVEGATPELEAKLREVGFSEGDEVEMLAHGPFGGRTLAVRLNRSIIALRGAEAGMIVVEDAT